MFRKIYVPVDNSDYSTVPSTWPWSSGGPSARP